MRKKVNVSVLLDISGARLKASKRRRLRQRKGERVSDMEYDAHRRTDPDGTVHTQTVYDHLLGTACRAAQCLRSAGLEQAGYLA